MKKFLLVLLLMFATPAFAKSSPEVDVSVRIANYSMIELKPTRAVDKQLWIAHSVSGDMPADKIMWCDEERCTLVYAF